MVRHTSDQPIAGPDTESLMVQDADEVNAPTVPTRSTRTIKPPHWLQDYVRTKPLGALTCVYLFIRCTEIQ